MLCCSDGTQRRLLLIRRCHQPATDDGLVVIRQTVRTVARRVRFGIADENIDSRFDELVIHEVTDVQQQTPQQSQTSTSEDDWFHHCPVEMLAHRLKRLDASIGNQR